MITVQHLIDILNTWSAERDLFEEQYQMAARPALAQNFQGRYNATVQEIAILEVLKDKFEDGLPMEELLIDIDNHIKAIDKQIQTREQLAQGNTNVFASWQRGNAARLRSLRDIYSNLKNL